MTINRALTRRITMIEFIGSSDRISISPCSICFFFNFSTLVFFFLRALVYEHDPLVVPLPPE